MATGRRGGPRPTANACSRRTPCRYTRTSNLEVSATPAPAPVRTVRRHRPLGRLGAALGIACLLLSAPASALSPDEEVGVPYLTNYDPKTHLETIGYQSWAAVQDQRGVMYFGNTAGVVEYDGVTWRLLPLPGRSAARALARDGEGRILVGGQGTFGHLAPGPTGQLIYTSLANLVPDRDRQFADVWKVHATAGGAWFQTFTQLFFWDGSAITVLRPQTTFHMSFLVDGVLYVLQEGLGLFRLGEGGLEPVPGGDLFADQRVYAMVPHPSGDIVVGTRSSGLFRLTGAGANRWPTEADHYLAESQLYHGAALDDGSFALATLRGGVVLIDRDGHILHVLDRSLGIQDSTVTSVYPDDRGGLWLTLDRNLTRVEIPASFTVFGEVSGLAGSVHSILRDATSLVVATTQGVYRLAARGEPGRPSSLPTMVPVEGIATQCWQLLQVDDALFVATNDGVFLVRGTTATLVSPVRALSLLRSGLEPGRLYVGLLDGLSTLQHRDGSWQDGGRVPGIRDEVRTLAEEPDGTLWLGGRYRGVLRVLPPDTTGSGWQVETFDQESGLPVGSGRTRVHRVGRRILFATSAGLLRFLPSERRFRPADDLGSPFNEGGRWVTVLREGRRGDVWVVSGPDTGVGVIRQAPLGGPLWYAAPFRRIPARGVWEVFPEDDGVVWFGTSNGLIRYDERNGHSDPPPLRCLIRSVRSLHDDLPLYHGAGSSVPAGSPCVLPYARNALRFEFAAPNPGAESTVEYQHRLDGFDRGWSPWSREVRREYTNLPEGRYAFRVRARVPGGQRSVDAAFEVLIRPPWQRTWWAYLAYLALGSAGLLGLVRVQARWVQRKERAEAEHRRREYEMRQARAIQRHMLPTRPPRLPHLDIAALQRTATEVGGDYYDFFPQPDGTLFMAVGDATGHGLGAGLMVAATKTALLSLRGDDLPTVATELNGVLRRVNLGARLNMALTLLAFRAEPDGSVQVEASGGGMVPMYVLRASGTVEETVVEGLPLGALASPDYRRFELRLGPSDALVLMSDGLLERAGPQGEPFGFERVVESLRQLAVDYRREPDAFSPHRILDHVLTAGDEWSRSDTLEDDITIVVLKVPATG